MLSYSPSLKKYALPITTAGNTSNYLAILFMYRCRQYSATRIQNRSMQDRYALIFFFLNEGIHIRWRYSSESYVRAYVWTEPNRAISDPPIISCPRWSLYVHDEATVHRTGPRIWEIMAESVAPSLRIRMPTEYR
jgi:hypothetical protein